MVPDYLICAPKNIFSMNTRSLRYLLWVYYSESHRAT